MKKKKWNQAKDVWFLSQKCNDHQCRRGKFCDSCWGDEKLVASAVSQTDIKAAHVIWLWRARFNALRRQMEPSCPWSINELINDAHYWIKTSTFPSFSSSEVKIRGSVAVNWISGFGLLTSNRAVPVFSPPDTQVWFHARGLFFFSSFFLKMHYF